MTNHEQNIMRFLFETGHLKKVPRAGWQLLGIPNPESVADHTCRSVFVAYILAVMEGANAEKAALIAAFHELPETRIGDLHKVAQNYILNKKEIEAKVLKDQLSLLPDNIAKGFSDLLGGFDHDSSKEHVIAKDADYIEVMIQAKEYVEQGYSGAQNWIDNSIPLLKTESAKKLAAQIVKMRSTEWYEGLKRIAR